MMLSGCQICWVLPLFLHTCLSALIPVPRMFSEVILNAQNNLTSVKTCHDNSTFFLSSLNYSTRYSFSTMQHMLVCQLRLFLIFFPEIECKLPESWGYTFCFLFCVPPNTTNGSISLRCMLLIHTSICNNQLKSFKNNSSTPTNFIILL